MQSTLEKSQAVAEAIDSYASVVEIGLAHDDRDVQKHWQAKSVDPAELHLIAAMIRQGDARHEVVVDDVEVIIRTAVKLNDPDTGATVATVYLDDEDLQSEHDFLRDVEYEPLTRVDLASVQVELPRDGAER